MRVTDVRELPNGVLEVTLDGEVFLLTGSKALAAKALVERAVKDALELFVLRDLHPGRLKR